MKPRIAVASEIESLLDDPAGDVDLTWFSGAGALPKGTLNGVVSLLTKRWGPEEMDAYPDLAVIANVATGFDNIDLAAAAARGIVVTNTPDVLTAATADLTMALLLAAMRRVGEGIEMLRRGAWTGWHPTQLLGRDLDGATLGIVGAGRIGVAVARRAAAFGMRLVYASRSASSGLEDLGALRVAFEVLLQESDCVTLHVPLTAETTHMIGAPEFRLMRSHAILVNTARGGIVDEGALVDALDARRIAGAGLDVFEGEPEVRSALLRHPRIVALPHIGSATIETRKAMANLAWSNAVEVVLGRSPITPVTR